MGKEGREPGTKVPLRDSCSAGLVTLRVAELPKSLAGPPPAVSTENSPSTLCQYRVVCG